MFRVPALPLAVAATAFSLWTSGCTDRGFGTGFRAADHTRTQDFVQLSPSKADVLWVVDSSSSMEDEQLALVENFPSFIEFFIERRLDFHIAVTSTNIHEEGTDGLDGRMVGDPHVITSDMEDVAGEFLTRATLGIDPGHHSEKGLEAAWYAIEELGRSYNDGFYRDDAHLAIIVVSDEPYGGRSNRPVDPDIISWEDFADWLDGLKGETGYRMTDLSAIVGIGPDGFDDPEPCGREEGQNRGGAVRGDGYLEAAEATGGTWGSICEEDWGELLGRVGLRAAGLMDNFPLLDVPDPETLTVHVDGLQRNVWEYRESTNSIRFTTFDSVPRPGQEVRVRFKVEGWDDER